MKAKTTDKVKLCKGCNKPLPNDYKGKYCQSCMNNQVDKGKSVLKGIGSILGLLLMVITLGHRGKK